MYCIDLPYTLNLIIDNLDHLKNVVFVWNRIMSEYN